MRSVKGERDLIQAGPEGLVELFCRGSTVSNIHQMRLEPAEQEDDCQVDDAKQLQVAPRVLPAMPD